MRLRPADAPFILLVLAAAGLLATLAWTFVPPVPPAGIGPAAAPATAPAVRAAVDAAEPRAKPELPSPAELAGKFGPRVPRKASGASPRPHPAPPPAGPTEKADWLRAVGSFEDRENRRWLLVKDERRGRVIKLRSDGAAGEEGRLIGEVPEGLVLELGSKRYAVKGR